MNLHEAYYKTKELNRNNTTTVSSLVYRNYKGWNVETIPVELALVRNSLNITNQCRKSFETNVKNKYGR